MVPSNHKVVVCVMKGGFPGFSSFYRGIDSQSGSVCPDSGCLSFEGGEGGHGTLKVVFQ